MINQSINQSTNNIIVHNSIDSTINQRSQHNVDTIVNTESFNQRQQQFQTDHNSSFVTSSTQSNQIISPPNISVNNNNKTETDEKHRNETEEGK